MGFLGLFKSDKELVHLKNLILIASADSDFKSAELSVITSIMSRMNISEKKFEKALNQLVSDNKIKVVGGKMVHTGNVLSSIEVVSTKSSAEKLKYLKDYVFIMMADGSIDIREKKLCQQIALKMGWDASAVDMVVQMVQSKTGILKEDNTTTTTKRDKVSPKTARAIKTIMSQVGYLSDTFQPLDDDGKLEALLLCTSMAFTYGHLDKNTQQEIIRALVSTAEAEHDFINNRIAFYTSEIRKVTQNRNYSPMALYNVIYVHPLCDDPHDLSNANTDIASHMLFYTHFVQIANNLADNL